MPLTLLISSIEQAIVLTSSTVLKSMRNTFNGRLCRRVPRQEEEVLEVVSFLAFVGENRVYLRNTAAVRRLIHSCNNPCQAICGLQCTCMEQYSRRQLRVTELKSIDQVEDDLGQQVNRLVEGWAYFVREVPQSEADVEEDSLRPSPQIESSAAGAGPRTSLLSPSPLLGPRPAPEEQTEQPQLLQLKLFLDHNEEYPAVIGERYGHRVSGKLEVVKTSPVSWTLALIVTFGIVTVCVVLFCTLVSVGVTSLSNELPYYKIGVEELVNKVQPLLPKGIRTQMREKVESFLNNSLPDLISSAVVSLENIGVQGVLFMIYLFFWIFEPLPISGSVTRLFKSYLFLKTLVCIMFGTLMSLLLLCLNCRLWSLFFIITFLLNYLPEVGAIVSALLMVPAVLFDGRVPFESRCWHAVWLAIVGTLIKLFTGNVVEVRMYAKKGGQFMRMHPVILMFMLMAFYALLGVTGMFLAVPIMAAVKYYMLSINMPHQYRDRLLVFIEGDETGPHKNYVEQVLAERKPQVPVEHDVEALLPSACSEAADAHGDSVIIRGADGELQLGTVQAPAPSAG
eukprot:CAMPEP_0178400692 /NCGR_PEP_ID=MMETSP0689_2-20121128/15920_1 /TAXON_ID=160604 /ORGANISM="Amphidinium massartii, Strain CS-259" /LENGTH=565 /DNA_ID=CAMNT_0020021495 /DNA_START=98 /DNA_END=1795 /DNA_ORIENTATION=+